MTTTTIEKLESSFRSFFEVAHRVLEINTEDDYKLALEVVEHLMQRAEDREGEPLLHMIDMVADAIEVYEVGQDSVSEYMQEVESIDPAVSTLRLLIDQHSLSYSDLQEEIGSKSLISQILSGARNLTKTHITNLSKRFQISPALFF